MTALPEVGLLFAGSVSPAWIQAGVTALSVLLTGLLVRLYDEQRRLNAAEYEAAVRTEGHRPSEDGTALDICLSNLGRGPATDLRLRVTPVFVGSDGYSGHTVETEPIKRLCSPRDADVAPDWIRPTRNYIGPERYFVEYRTPIPVKWTDPAGDESRTSLQKLPEGLPKSVTLLRLVVTLRYCDRLGNEQSKRIVDDVLPLERGETMQFLFSRGMTYDEYERRKANDAIADPFDSLAVHRPHLCEAFRTNRQNERENE